jgi:hypothetical protein
MAKRTSRQRKKFREMLLKRDGRCMVCGKYLEDRTINPHHITTKGAGGDDQPENGISLCQACHVAVHNGQHSPASLRWILKFVYGYTYPSWQLGGPDDCEAARDHYYSRHLRTYEYF